MFMINFVHARIFPIPHNVADISCVFEKILTGTSIGKRYARTDELGVPFAITVDMADSVTIRERDTKNQVRVKVTEAASVVKEVTDGHKTWADVWSTFPHHSSASADE